ncbi:hypothetical protein [Rickettsia endosymbiont of Polydrusus tereticollis]
MNIAESLAISKVIVVPEKILGSGNFIPLSPITGQQKALKAQDSLKAGA